MSLGGQLAVCGIVMMLGGAWWRKYALGIMRIWLKENDPVESVGLSNLEVPGRYRQVRSVPRDDRSMATAFWLAMALQVAGISIMILAWQVSRPRIGP